MQDYQLEMLHLVLNNRTCPGPDQSNPRNQLRATIFGHRCTDKDVLLKEESAPTDEEFSAPEQGTCSRQNGTFRTYRAPAIVYQLNQEKHFRVWKNLALHLIEQIGYVHKSNCVQIVVFEKSVLFECKLASERNSQESSSNDRLFFHRIRCRNERELVANFSLGDPLMRHISTAFAHQCEANGEAYLRRDTEDGTELRDENLDYW